MTLILILALGTFFRAAAVSHPRSFWGDEWASVAASSESYLQTIVTHAKDVHPPVYYLILNFFIKLLGFNELAFRLPSLLAGIALIAAAYFLAKEIFDKNTALLTAGFISISPFFTHSSIEIRNHGMPALWTVLATLSFLKIIKGAYFKLWACYFLFFCLLSLYTSHTSWFWFISLATLHFQYSRRQSLPTHARHLLPLACGLAIPVFILMFFHAADDMDRSLLLYLQDFGISTLIERLGGVYWDWALGPAFFRTAIAWLITITLFSLAIKGWLAVKKVCFEYFIYTGTLCFGSIIVWAIYNPHALEARYFGSCAVVYVMLLSHGLLMLRNKWLQKGIFIIYAGASLFNLFHIVSMNVDPIRTELFLEMTEMLSKESTMDDLIYSDDEKRLRYYASTLPHPLKAKVTGQLDPTKLITAKRIWVYNSPGEGYSEFKPFQDQMASFGFNGEYKHFVFRGKSGLLFLTVFDKS